MKRNEKCNNKKDYNRNGGKRPQNRKQPRKDSADPRVNYDNTRKNKFEKDIVA